MEKKLVDALRNFSNKKILVVGDIMLDRTERGHYSERINPEDPAVKIINLYEETFYPGAAANVAINVASLGAKSVLFGAIGKDIYGQKIKELTKKGKVNIENLVEAENPTIVKTRRFVDGEYNTRSDLGENNLKHINENLKREMLFKMNNELKAYDAIILSDYNKHLFDEEFTRQIISLAKRDNIKVFSDVKPTNLDYFKGSYVVSPNKGEASEITKLSYENDPKKLLEMGKIISQIIGSGKAIITLGEEGAYVFDNGNSKIIPTKAKKVVEVTGAGDTFIATLALGNSSGLDIFNSVELANYASGIVVGKEGTATTNIAELFEEIAKEDK